MTITTTTIAQQGAEGRRWSDLPDLFLDLVARRLSLVDHMRFGLVCKPWRSVATAAPPCPQPPWLLSSSRDSGELVCYSFWEDRTIRFRLPLGMIGWQCHAASHGWLFMAAAPNGPEVCLLNPVTRARIDLPPLSRDRHISFIPPPRYGALSSDPATATATGDRAVVVVECRVCRALICRIGDKHWTVLRDSPISRNVAFHKGLPQMMEGRGILVAYNLYYKKSRIVPRWFNDKWKNWASYLIEDRREGDDLLQVLLVPSGLRKNTSGCVVLKLVGNKDGSSQRWVRMKNLGGAALFLSMGHSELVSADACVTMGMKGDYVYELDRSSVLWEISMEDGSEPTTVHYLRQACNMLYFGLWFNPNIPSSLNRRKRVEKIEHSLSFKKKKKRKYGNCEDAMSFGCSNMILL